MSAAVDDLHFEQLFNSEYVRYFDVETPILVKIVSVRREELNIPGTSNTEVKPVLYFEPITGDIDKTKLVLNKTNATSIAGIHGIKVSGWIGKEVVFYKDKTRLRGKPVDCVRIRAAKRKG